MPALRFTKQQHQAIRTTGKSVIVSAAAGSGKTAVLAERCAHLVCDAPPDVRCNVDELLVLTFTDAAAAQMRSRIVEAIRSRVLQHPRDDRLREQVALVESARISTIHSFCLWLVRRWFSHVNIDPAATVMDDNETTLVKGEVLDALLAELYATTSAPDDPLGRIDLNTGRAAGTERAAGLSPRGPAEWEGTQDRRDDPGENSSDRPNTALGAAFVRLVDDYGLGEDREIARFVLRLFDFLASLPDPEAWLNEACCSLSDHPETVVLATRDALKIELDRQVEHCEQLAAGIDAGDPVGHPYASQVRNYVEQLRAWIAALEPPRAGRSKGKPGVNAGTLAQFESVRQQIAEFEFGRTRAARLAKDATPETRAARDQASAQLSNLKKHLFGDRLKLRFGLFPIEELIDGLRQTAPYVATVADVTLAFRDAYARKKRGLGVLDFADLQRLAFDLLNSDGDSHNPSDIARRLHGGFAHVLVDEFQDINPIQRAIIELVSHESDPDRPGNLFVVGDVKQSIYRFRLAEPAIFTERLERFRREDSDGTAVFLQKNFRSRPEILEAVNVIFAQLMQAGRGDIVYDVQAELRPGRESGESELRKPVELHVLEGSWKEYAIDDREPELGVADLSNPARWAPIEREAFLAGSRIREFMEGREPKLDGDPLRYRDIVILLRAARVNAERVAAMLTSMGISSYADVGGSLFGAREIRDVVAALELLDNFQQDIPLAAVLRSGIMGNPLSADDLVEIRCSDRDIPFHDVVRQYAKSGGNADLRERLCAVLDRVNRYRAEVRRRPLADILWNIYEQQGFLAHAGGLRGASQRQANLLKLHEFSRQFGSFRRQGLHRFLRFIRSLEEEDQTIAPAPAIGEADDVVRIMSIHQAKGLEFPIVFVAGLGTKFNLGDRSGRMIFERRTKIGLRVVDTNQMIEYPSAAHRQVVSEIEDSTRQEELRILYVAMTRAAEKLILVGSARDVHRFTGLEPRAQSAFSVASAMTPLDWLMPALAVAPADTVRGLGEGIAAEPLFDVHLHDVEEMAGWSTIERSGDSSRAVRVAAARCGPLPADEQLAPDDPTVERVLSRIEYTYPQMASASVRASVAASEFKGGYDFTRDPEERRSRLGVDDFLVPPSRYTAAVPDKAAHRGIIAHRVLQHLDFAAAVDMDGVASELHRMVDEGLITIEDRAVVDQVSISWFVSTPLAEAIRQTGAAYRREFLYIAAEPLGYFDRSIGSPSSDRVLVRGIVDGILPVADGIDIVDFKTDAVGPEAVTTRAARYRPQMDLYARAMSRLWRRPVRTCWLVFLVARTCHAVRDGAWS